MWNILILYLVIVEIHNTESKQRNFHTRYDPRKWLKEYEISNVTVKFAFKRQGFQNFDYFLEFSCKTGSFKVGLLKNDVVKNTTLISVNGKIRDPTEFSSKETNLYKGNGYQGYKYVDYVVLLTRYGLDGILKVDRNTLIIEPAQSNRNVKNENSYIRKRKKTTVFSCIIYKPEDIIDHGLVSRGISSNKLFPREDIKTLAREKRSGDEYATDCSLHVVADHTFFREAGHGDIAATISEMMFFVSEANTIFRSTDFDGDGAGDNVGFYISHISVFTEADYKMSDTSLTVFKYLDAFSEYNFNDYCLGVAFSCRDFADGVIGLAWVASSSNYGSAGGICQKRGIFQNKYYSLNTNIITLFNSGERMPSYKSALTLTHELGHSFGSPHDLVSDVTCVPNGDFGNYIMYPYANDGSKPNHIQFSACSIGYMFPVIKNKGTCFTSSVGICGNGIKEKYEECDCGTMATCDLLDPCCTPSDVRNTYSDLPCTIRRSEGKLCSRISSPCCTETCKYSKPDQICRVGGDCIKPSYCNGTSGECPQTTFESDEKLCNNNRKTCRAGKCIGSICSLFNSTDCECPLGPYECHICCFDNNNQCTPVNFNEEYIIKPVGVACHKAQGFCDKSAKCVLQDPESVINRMNQMFSQTNINEVTYWMSKHWYYIVAAIAGLSFISAIFIATCRQRMDVHTSAFMYGQFMRIKREAEIQKQYIENRQKVVKSKFEAELKKIEKGSKRMSLPKAVARLKVFFPTVPNEELEKLSKLSSREEMAVTLLLTKGYPFRRISDPIYPKETHL